MALRKFNRWSETEVAIFLKLVAEERIQQELEGHRNGKVYKELSQRMATHGYDRSPQTCREKLKKMKSDYNAIKEHSRRGILYRSDWKWFGQMEAIYGLGRNGRNVEVKQKQEWSVEETGCLIALWSSPEAQNTFAGRAKLMIEFIRLEMASAGFHRTVEQINNKLKKLKMEYMGKKKELNCSDLAEIPFYEMMASVLGNTRSCSLAQRLSPAAAIPESIAEPSAGIGLSVEDNKSPNDTGVEPAPCKPSSSSFLTGGAKNVLTGLSTKDEMMVIADTDMAPPPPPPLLCNTVRSAANDTGRGLSADVKRVDSSDDLPPPPPPPPPPLQCNSPSPSCSSKESSRTKRAKCKRPSDGLLEYLERSDERFFQFSRELLHRMEEDTKSLLGLLGRMVTVMEASNKNNNEHHPNLS
ncbi:uncharacterized protein si:dkey-261j15.2 isoform X1 [Phyllopteryx taeniolatus]|uniref:uncharacterized protein si:dkey-261j15.2 isoform X1 n=1 Tax=Phyllopteryx taeniolatus TaxID=161469 RepID=UPI002AD3E91F|nr:uncharacterized protein si:dkey-261j15.2 isoform X1 [Phyllopteryx taeniolatus]